MAHLLQLNMHPSAIVAEKLCMCIVTFNSKLTNSDSKLICLLQEPPIGQNGPCPPPLGYSDIFSPHTDMGSRTRSVIWAPSNLDPVFIAQLSSPDLAVGRISLGNKAVLLTSLYLPHSNTEDDLIPNDMLSRFLRPHLKSAILAGDLNSNSLIWDSPITCQRGEHIKSFVALNIMS